MPTHRIEPTGRSPLRRAGKILAAAAPLAGLLLLLGGCATGRNLARAKEEATKEHWDLAVLEYSRALETDPGNEKIRIELQRARFSASQHHFNKGRAYRAAANLPLAQVELQMAVAMDPNNAFAASELAKVEKEIAEIETLGRQKTAVERLKEQTRGARVQPPMLNPKSNEPLSLSFPKETNVKDIYTAVAKAAGINVIFDPQLKDDKVTVDLRDVSLKRALEILMRQATHFYKVLDEETIIIAADTPQNRKDYEDLVIKTFFLSSGDVKEVMNVLRTLIEARRIAMNPQLNAIVIRDTVDKVAVAERIVESNDKAKAEVIIDVELLQVNSGNLKDLGVDMTMNLTQSLVPNSGNAQDPWHWEDIVNINSGNWVFGGLPSFTYTFLKNNGEASLLARPQLRVTEGEKATLTIGDRVPIPTTTFNTSNTIGGSVVPITSFQYQDVGIKIDVEPRVHHNREVTLKLTVEVSQLGEPQPVGNGQTQPSIGTRTITSILRLKDGESNFLAGLIRTDREKAVSGIPFLMDIPVIGTLFSHVREKEIRKDLLLTLTPRIIRMPDITDEDLLPIWVGTEQNVTFQGTTTRIESPADRTPFDESRPLQPSRDPGGTGGPASGVRSVGGGGAAGGGPLVGIRGGKPAQGGGGPPAGGVKPNEAAPVDGAVDGESPDGGPPVPMAAPAFDEPAGGETEAEGEVDLRTPRLPAVAVLRLDMPSRVTLGEEFEGTLVLEGAGPGIRFPAALIWDPLVLDIVSIDTAPAVRDETDQVEARKQLGSLLLDWTVGAAGDGGGDGVRIRIRWKANQQGATSMTWTGGLGTNAEGKSAGVALSPALVRVDPKGAGRP